MVLSDECDEEDNISAEEKAFINEKVLGHKKDYMDCIDDIETEK